MAKKRKDVQPNQGEGNQTAAADYDDKATRHARSGNVPKEAQHAREAVEGTEGEALRDAEIEGKRHMKEEDPEVSGS